MIPFFPRVGGGSALEGMLGSCSDHGLFGDWYIAILHEILAILLLADVKNEGDRGINALLKFVEVGIKVNLVDVVVAIVDVVNKILDFHAIESFGGIFNFGIVDGFDGLGRLIDRNAAYMVASLPVFLCFVIEYFELFVCCSRGAERNSGIRVRPQEGCMGLCFEQ